MNRAVTEVYLMISTHYVGECREMSKKFDKNFAEKCHILTVQSFIYMTGGFWDYHLPHENRIYRLPLGAAGRAGERG